MSTPDPLVCWLALRAVPGIGLVLYRRLLEKFGDPAAVFAAPPEKLLQVKGLRPPVVQAIKGFTAWEPWTAMLARLQRWRAQLLTFPDPAYPERLRQIPYAPPFLLLKGQLLLQDDPAVAIVGTRRPSPYGVRIARQLATDLARQGITVISGLARGIDTIAHRAALAAGGRTLAVLGCGLDVIYPPENRDLYRQIATQGALISEFPLGTPPEPYNFPIRNRLISGLACAVVIVEAGEQSGAHITVKFALEQGREVYAVPGPVDSPVSRGPNRWIQQGAKPVLSATDIIADLPLARPSQTPAPAASKPAPPADPLVELLDTEPRHLEDIIRASGQPAAQVLSRLTMLELQGFIRELPGKFYVLAESLPA